MNIRTVFMYFFLTVILVYLMLFVDNKYFCKGVNATTDKKDEQILRHSISCGVIMWVIIVYFIYKAENEIPSLTARNQIVLEGKF